jgi:hypothetical protein
MISEVVNIIKILDISNNEYESIYYIDYTELTKKLFAFFDRLILEFKNIKLICSMNIIYDNYNYIFYNYEEKYKIIENIINIIEETTEHQITITLVYNNLTEEEQQNEISNAKIYGIDNLCSLKLLTYNENNDNNEIYSKNILYALFLINEHGYSKGINRIDKIFKTNKTFLSILLLNLKGNSNTNAILYELITNLDELTKRNFDDIVYITLIKNGHNIDLLHFAPDKIKSDRELFKIAVTNNGNLIKFASDNLRDDIEIVNFALIQTPHAFHCLSDKLRNDIDIVKSLIPRYLNIILHVSKEIKNNIEIIKLYAENKYKFFPWDEIYPDFKKSQEYKELFNEYILNYPDMLHYYHKEIDTDVIKKMLKNNGLSLKFLLEEYKTYDLCLDAVTQNGLALQWCEKFNNFSEIVEIAVKQNGLALKFASNGFKNVHANKNIVLSAVLQNGLALEFTYYYYYYNNSYHEDEDITLAAVKENGLAIQYVNIKTDELILESVKQNGLALQYYKYKSYEYSFAYEAVKNNGLALQYVPNDIKNLELCRLAVQNNGFALQYVPDNIKNMKLCYLALEPNNPLALQYVSNKFKDIELCIIALKQNINTYKYCNYKTYTRIIDILNEKLLQMNDADLILFLNKNSKLKYNEKFSDELKDKINKLIKSNLKKSYEIHMIDDDIEFTLF